MAYINIIVCASHIEVNHISLVTISTTHLNLLFSNSSSCLWTAQTSRGSTSPVNARIAPNASLTFLAQEEGVEAEMVDAEVQPALAGNPALPAAAGVIGDQLLRLREVEPGFELYQGLSELLRLFLLLGKPAAGLLGNQSLTHRKITDPTSAKGTRQRREGTAERRHLRSLHCLPTDMQGGGWRLLTQSVYHPETRPHPGGK